MIQALIMDTNVLTTVLITLTEPVFMSHAIELMDCAKIGLTVDLQLFAFCHSLCNSYPFSIRYC
jgi:hypothetical protein